MAPEAPVIPTTRRRGFAPGFLSMLASAPNVTAPICACTPGNFNMISKWD